MKKFANAISVAALITALVLLIPITAMQFTDEVQWSSADFVLAGVFIFGSMVFYLFMTRYLLGFSSKLAAVFAAGSTLLLVWVNLAVGLISGGPHPGNLMYIGVVAVVIIGSMATRFSSTGMKYTMFAASGSVVLVGAIALSAGMQHYPDSSIAEILGVNAFFAALFLVSGLLFEYAAISQQEAK